MSVRVSTIYHYSFFILHYSFVLSFTFFLSPIDSHPPSSYNKNCHMPGRQGYRRDTGCCRDRVETPRAGMSRRCRKSKASSNAASLPGDAEACTVADCCVCSPCRPIRGRRGIFIWKKEGRYGQWHYQRRHGRRTKKPRGIVHRDRRIGIRVCAFPGRTIMNGGKEA